MSFVRLSAVGCLWLVVQTASAQDVAAEADSDLPAESETEDVARIHFQAGRAHFNAERYEDALGEFSRAYELSERATLLFNIGLTHV